MIYNGSNRSIIIIILMGHGNIHKRRRGRRMVDDESHRFLPVVYGRTTTSSPTRIGEISNQYANQKVYYFSSINEIFDHHPHRTVTVTWNINSISLQKGPSRLPMDSNRNWHTPTHSALELLVFIP